MGEKALVHLYIARGAHHELNLVLGNETHASYPQVRFGYGTGQVTSSTVSQCLRKP